jgi:hypothetical protein
MITATGEPVNKGDEPHPPLGPNLHRIGGCYR